MIIGSTFFPSDNPAASNLGAFATFAAALLGGALSIAFNVAVSAFGGTTGLEGSPPQVSDDFPGRAALRGHPSARRPTV